MNFLNTNYKKRHFKLDLWPWLILYYPILLYKALINNKQMGWDLGNTKLGYLTLLATMAIGGFSIGVYLVTTLLQVP